MDMKVKGPVQPLPQPQNPKAIEAKKPENQDTVKPIGLPPSDDTFSKDPFAKKDTLQMDVGGRAFNGSMVGLVGAGGAMLTLPLMETAKGGSYLKGFMATMKRDLPAAATGGVVGGALAAMIPGDSMTEKAIVTGFAAGASAAVAKFTGGNVGRALVVGGATGAVSASGTDLLMKKFDK